MNGDLGNLLDRQRVASRLCTPDLFPPAWASASGSDYFGLWASLSLEKDGAVPVTQRFRWINAGEFVMGSPLEEVGRQPDEGAQRHVQIGSGFWLADTACTQALWQVVMQDNPAHFQGKVGGGPHHPVEQVSWLMVQDFLQQLGSILPSNLHILPTLPTEAEWEYCCRAGTSTPFSFGTTIHTGQVNFHGRGSGLLVGKGDYRGKTIVVNELPANTWGLYQMHGNVWEWCADPWQDFSQSPPKQFELDPGLSFALKPMEYNQTVERVLRGGSWVRYARLARSANRNYYAPSDQYREIGFRFALRHSCQDPLA